MIKRNYYKLGIIRIQALYFGFLCAFALFSNDVVAQESNTNIDTSISKEMELFISQSDSIDKIEEFIQDTFSQKKDTLLGLAYCNSFLKRGKAQEDYEIQYFSNFQIAYVSYFQPNYREALKHAYISVKVAEKMKDTINSISSSVLLGSTWYVLGTYDEALESYLTAKKLSTLTKNSPYEIICLTNVANIRAKLNRFEDALKSYNSILKILDEKEGASFVQYIPTYLSSLIGKMLCLTELGAFEEAQQTYDKGIALAKANNLEIFKGRLYINLGRVHYEKNEYHTSLGFLKQGREILVNQGLQNNLYITDFYIAKNFHKQGKYEEAISLLDTIFENIGDDTNTDRIEEMYELAIDISKIQNNKEKEIFYYRESQNIIKEKNRKILSAKDLLYEDDIKEQELENEKLTSEKTKSLVDKRIIIVISVILLVAFLLGFLSYHKKTKLKEQRFLAIIEDISKKATLQRPQKASQNSKIKDEKAKIILEKLQELETTHFYLSQDVTLHATAKLLNTNTTYLSKALNDVKKQSFSQYLNKLRIDYALVKLKEDSVFRSYTIHAISKEIGYKSATTFIKEFKNKTGLNPSYYIKKIEN